MKKLAAIGLASLALSGCATSAISAKDATPVPNDRLMGLQFAPDGPHGSLVVTRDSGFMGSACKTIISVDGERVGEIKPSEVASFYVPIGYHIIGAEIDAAICPNVLKEREFTISEGDVRRYRISMDSSTSMDLSPTAK